MQKIKILDHQEAIKIAAGEVVERPSHILKELIENSIDAGATQITIHTKKAGKELLSIIDNGCGMSPEDARLCFAHHATSKISTVNDLESITTYGFRGEALSSIASVAKVELTTKTDSDKSAIQLTLQNGVALNEQFVAHPTGTSLVITHLFDAIPARKKFLKSDDTEWNSIVSIFQAFCLRYINIHFKLFHNDHVAYNCPATTNIAQRCAQLWNNELHDQLIDIDLTIKNNISITGATSKSQHHRYNRNQIFTFVNNRWVKNIELSRAIIKGYQNVLPPQKYPSTFLFIHIDPKEVDINIHPKKEEVKFLHPGIIQTCIQETITQSLNKSICQKKDINLKNAQSFVTFENKENNKSFDNISNQTDLFDNNIITEQLKQNNQENSEFFDNHNVSENFNVQKISFDQPFKENLNLDQDSKTFQTLTHRLENNIYAQAKTFSTEQVINQKSTESQSVINQSIYESEPFTIIGQFLNTYILIEQANKLIMIDQHAAHERIIYEQLKKHFAEVATIQLLFPQIVKLKSEDLTMISELLDLFKSHGIDLEPFSSTEIIIQATPVSLQHKAVADIITTSLEWIKEHQHIDKQDFFKELNESIHAQKACKTAVKAGDILNFEQMQNIVKTLFNTDNRFCCPHGRPTIWHMDQKDIEKKFKRDYRSAQQNILF